MTAQTLAQKIIARAAGRDVVAPGEIVTCAVDLALMHDSGGPRRVKPMLEKLGAKVWDPDKVVVLERWVDEAALKVHAALSRTQPSLTEKFRVGAGQREDYVYNRTR